MLSEAIPTSVGPRFPTAPRALIPVGTNKTFKHTIDIYLKDSNAYANTYFARYFEWQGICRERWFFQCISPDMLQAQGVFVTKRAHQEYVQETFPFQSVDCRLNTFDVKQCSFHLLFEFLVAGETVSSRYQQIGCQARQTDSALALRGPEQDEGVRSLLS